MFYIIISIVFIIFIIGFIKCRRDIVANETKINEIEEELIEIENNLKFFYNQYQEDKK